MNTSDGSLLSVLLPAADETGTPVVLVGCGGAEGLKVGECVGLDVGRAVGAGPAGPDVAPAALIVVDDDDDDLRPWAGRSLLSNDDTDDLPGFGCRKRGGGLDDDEGEDDDGLFCSSGWPTIGCGMGGPPGRRGRQRKPVACEAPNRAGGTGAQNHESLHDP